MKRIGILAHSAEGAALCFLEAVHEGERRMGAHAHPDIVLDIEQMGVSLADWEAKDYAPIAERFRRAAIRLAVAGAQFFICPDNTAHIALEAMERRLALPGLHIAEIVAGEAARRGFRKIGITGTRWTMEGPVYPGAFGRRGLHFAAPDARAREEIQRIIFDELVLGCTELPMLLDDTTSPLPVLDSTRLLARAAVDVALGTRPLPDWRGGPLG